MFAMIAGGIGALAIVLFGTAVFALDRRRRE
jgi:hypothetical protein